MSDELQELVNRFLAWKLPTDFYPDCHIYFDREKAEKWGPQLWPSGTNLLHAGQARAMLEHVTEPLRAQLAAQPRQPLSEWIACSDRLPVRDGLSVLVYCPLIQKRECRLWGAVWNAADECFDADGAWFEPAEVEYWQPAPAAPDRAITGDKP